MRETDHRNVEAERAYRRLVPQFQPRRNLIHEHQHGGDDTVRVRSVSVVPRNHSGGFVDGVRFLLRGESPDRTTFAAIVRGEADGTTHQPQLPTPVHVTAGVYLATCVDSPVVDPEESEVDVRLMDAYEA